MLRKIVFLIVILLTVGSAQANLLVNGDFDSGVAGYVSVGGYAPDGWVCAAGVSGWHIDAPPEVVQGTMSMFLWWSDTVLAQQFAITENTTYDISLDVINTTAAGVILSPIGMDLVMYMQSYDAAWGFLDGVEVDRFQCGIDPDGAWTTIGTSYTTPAGTANGQIYFAFEGSDGTTHITYDNAVVTESLVQDPWPEHGTPQIADDVDAAGYLEFTLPGFDDSITNIDYYLLWDAGTDPNTPTSIVASGTGDPNERILVAFPETITTGYVYSWKIDLDITGGSLAGAYEGPTWWFTTTNAPPTVDTGEPMTQNVWISGGSAVVSLDGVTTDDNLPDPPGAVTETWSNVGPGSVTFSPTINGGLTANAAVATATFTTAGDYYLELAAYDGDFTVSDTIQVKVLADGYDGLVALYEFEGTANDTAPAGGNHHGTLATLATVDPILPVIDSLDAKVGFGSLLIGDVDQGVYVADSGVVDPNFIDGSNISATWADMQTTHQVTISTWLRVVPGLFGNAYGALGTKGASYGIVRFIETRVGMGYVGSWIDLDPEDPVDVYDTGIGPWLDNGRWHHVAVTYDGAYARYYVDGLLEGETYNPVYLDAMPLGGAYLQWGYGMSGRFDQVRVHEIALSADMIKAQYLADGGEANCRQQYAVLLMDFDLDCDVDIADFAFFASGWLDCTDLLDPSCTADDGWIPVGP